MSNKSLHASFLVSVVVVMLLSVRVSGSCLCSQVSVHFKPIAILLGHLKIPFEEIKQALLAMDEKKFTESHLKQLLLYAPDKEEVRKLKTNQQKCQSQIQYVVYF